MVIRLEGVKNIRDFSEYGYKDYIRSAHLNGMTDRDKGILVDRYHLRTVVDLRTTQEVREKPDAEIPGVAHMHIPIFDEVMPGISHEDEADEVRKMLPDMRQLYRALVTEEAYVGQIKKAMEVITDPGRDGAVLWHCTEGKDRCGIVSALFLLSRGIEPERVMGDYLRTNRTNYVKSWKYFILVMLSGRGWGLAANVQRAFLAKREYLEPVMGILEHLSRSFPLEGTTNKTNTL